MPSRWSFALLVALVPASSWADSLTQDEQQLVGLVNQSRLQAGLTPLQIDAGLSSVARAHSLDMATTGFFSHSSPMTGDMGDRFRAAGIDFAAAGENIALNQSVQAAHAALMNSPAHRQNLLSPDFTHLGIGIVSNGQQLLVTQAFLRPGRRFHARIPTIESHVEEPREEELVRVDPRRLPIEQEPQGGCAHTDDEVAWDEDDDEEDAAEMDYGPSLQAPVQQFAPQPAFPMVQVRPMHPQAVAPGGVYVVGPNGQWVQVRMQRAPVRVRRVVIPQARFLY